MGVICFLLAIVMPLLIEARKNPVVQPSAYEELEEYGFPGGLIPHTVVNYDLGLNGKFSVSFQSQCSAFLDGQYLVTYDSTITGVASYGSLKHLKGIRVRAFFINWTITAIHINNDNLVFEVGIASAQFPKSNFDESPTCQGNGFLAV